MPTIYIPVVTPSMSVKSSNHNRYDHELWKTLCSHIITIISLPAPMLYRIFDRFVLLHKSPIFTVFILYISPYFSGGISIRFASSFVFLTVRSLNQTTTDAQRNAQRENGWEIVSGCRLELIILGICQLRNLDARLSLIIRMSAVFGGGEERKFVFLRGQ